MFFYLYAYEPTAAGKGWKNAIVTWYQKFKESMFFRKLFFLAFVISMILFRTLLNRKMWMNPLSDVMGGMGHLGNGERRKTADDRVHRECDPDDAVHRDGDVDV